MAPKGTETAEVDGAEEVVTDGAAGEGAEGAEVLTRFRMVAVFDIS